MASDAKADHSGRRADIDNEIETLAEDLVRLAMPQVLTLVGGSMG